MTLRRDGVIQGVVLNVLGQVAIVASGGAVSILLARHYGKDVYGQWSASVSFGTMVGTIVEGGLNRILTREVARSHESAGKALGAVLKGRLVLSALVTPIALIAAWRVYPSVSWTLMLLSIAARVLGGVLNTYQSLLYAFEYFRAANLVETGRRLALFISVASLVFMDLAIEWAAVSTLIFTVVGTSYLVQLTRTVVKMDWSASLGAYWRDAFWFWINGILFWVNGEIAILILTKLAGNEAAGVNSAAQRLPMLFLIIPRGVNNSIVPKLFRSAKDGKNLHRQLNVTTLLLTAIAAVAAVEMWFGADQIIRLVFSAKYAEAAPALQAYALFLMLNFMRTPPSWYMTTSDRLTTVTMFFVASAALTITGNLLFVPVYGGIATAWTCAIAEALTFSLATIMTVKYTGPKILIAFALGLVPGALALLLHLAAGDRLPWLVTASVVSVIFIGAGIWVIKKIMAKWDPFGIFSSADQEAA